MGIEGANLIADFRDAVPCQENKYGGAVVSQKTEGSFTVPDEALYRTNRGHRILECGQAILKVTRVFREYFRKYVKRSVKLAQRSLVENRR